MVIEKPSYFNCALRNFSLLFSGILEFPRFILSINLKSKAYSVSGSSIPSRACCEWFLLIPLFPRERSSHRGLIAFLMVRRERTQSSAYLPSFIKSRSRKRETTAFTISVSWPRRSSLTAKAKLFCSAWLSAAGPLFPPGNRRRQNGKLPLLRRLTLFHFLPRMKSFRCQADTRTKKEAKNHRKIQL